MTQNISAGDSCPVVQTSTTASDWFAKGYLPLPIIQGQKNPRKKHSDWLPDLSESKIQAHWDSCPSDDVALHCSNGLIVLDADSLESERAIQALEQKHNLHSNQRVRTRKGIHYYYKSAPGVEVRQAGHSTENHPERIDIRIGNSYIIAPPSTDKELLVPEIVPFDQLMELTPAFVADLLQHNGKTTSASDQDGKAKALVKFPAIAADDVNHPEKLVEIKALIAHLDPDEGYSEWINVLMAIHHETEGSDDGLDIADEWSSMGEKYKGRSEIKDKWESFHGGTSSITMGTVRHMLKERGLDANQILGDVLRELSKENATAVWGVSGALQPIDPKTFPHQPQGRKWSIPGTIDNFAYLMQSHGVDIRYNEITKETTIRIPYLETSVDNADNVKRGHIKSLCVLNNFPAEHVNALCETIADQHRFNPVKEWISSSAWDGEDRLEAFYATLVTPEDYPIDFKKTLMKRWMISAVAAAYEREGFHCRGVLTLAGKQGIGKTSWVKSLVSEIQLRKEVVLTGHSLDASNKDSMMTAIQNWVVELGEVESTLRKLDLLKAFITKDMDTFRRPYASGDSTYPRRTVFFASVNDTHFLNDITGNSRWWTIPVVGVDYQHGIDMQQVFAQIKSQCYDQGERWWLDTAENDQLTALNKECEVLSPVRELLMAYLNDVRGEAKRFMSATALLQGAGIERPTRGQLKEAHALMTEVVGPKRKTGGVLGWDVPVKG